MVKGSRVGCGGRGDLEVRFDRLNELRDGKVSEFVEFDLSTFRHPSTFRSFDKLKAPHTQGLRRRPELTPGVSGGEGPHRSVALRRSENPP